MGSLKRLGDYIKKDKRARARAFSVQQSGRVPGQRQVKVCQQRRATTSGEEEEEPRSSVADRVLYSISLQLCYFSVPTPGQMVSKVPFLSDTLGLYSVPYGALRREERVWGALKGRGVSGGRG